MTPFVQAGIAGIGMSVPEGVMSNEDFTEFIDTSDEWIVTRTGISERRRLAPGEKLADHGKAAVEAALANAGKKAADLDLLIAATYSPDRFCPSLSCDVHALLGLNYIPAFDLNAACTGFIYSLDLARNLIATGAYKNIMILSAEGQSRYLDYSDRGTCILLGDGAAATLVSALEEGDGNGRGIHSTWLAADTKGIEQVRIEYSDPADPERIKDDPHPHRLYFRMNGREVFKFAVRVVGAALEEALQRAGKTAEEIDFLVPHQANIRIIQAAAERMGLPEERVLTNVQRYGNTAAASIPLALAEAERDGRLKRGMNLALVGFGAGFTYGSSIVTW